MTNAINNWTVKRLDEVATVTMGQSPPSSSYNTEGTGVPFLQGKPPVVDAMGAAVPNQWTTEPTRVVEAGTALMTVRAPVGELFTTNDSVCLGRGLSGIKAHNDVSQEYLNYYLQFAKNQLASVSQGSTFTAINSAELKGIEVALPSYQNQEYFSKILLVIDQNISKTDQIIEKTEVLKQGLMQDLLTKKDWQVQKISSISQKIQYGFTTKAIREDTGVKLLRITDIQDQMVNWDTVPFCKCPPNQLNDYFLKEGDILFARTGATTGKTYQVAKTPQAIFASYLIRVRVDSIKADSNFIYQFFQSELYWKQILSGQSGSAQGGFNATKLGNVVIPLPSIEDQRSISQMLDRLDKKRQLEIANKARLLTLKKGVMNDIFSKKVEVN